jgi:hypothetical protein
VSPKWLYWPAAAGGTPWTPDDLSATPSWWFDAHAITGLSNNDQLDTWDNLGSLADATRDATNSVAGYPRYRTGQLNGLPGVEWNERSAGKGTRMTAGNMGQLSTTIRKADLTVAAVWKTSSVAAGAAQIANASGYYEVAVNRTTARANIAFWNGAFGATTASTPTITTTTGFLTVGVWDRVAETRTIYVNGNQEAQSASLGATTYTASTEAHLGNNAYGAPANGQMFSGTIHELLILTDNASTSDREKVEGYLAHKWGLEGDLPIGHPYRNAAP